MAEVVLPQFGMGMADGTIIAWHKVVGDRVEQGEVLCEVEAAKTTVEVEAVCSGILQQIVAPAGQKVLVNAVIAIIGDAASAPFEEASKASPAPSSDTVIAADPPGPVPVTPGQGTTPPVKAPERQVVQVEPRARRAARLHGIELARVAGTGPGGRIVEEDVLRLASAPTGLGASLAAPATAAAAMPENGPIHLLRLRIDAGPLLGLLGDLAELRGQSIPAGAALVKAAALAMADAGIEGQGIGFRDSGGTVQILEDAATSSLRAIAAGLESEETRSANGAVLVVEIHEEDWLDEAICIGSAEAASLSFCLDTDGTAWKVVLSISDHVSGRENAKRFCKALRDLLARPFGLLV